MASSFGNHLKVTLFGESHGFAVGCVIEGLPPNVLLDMAWIDQCLEKRRPGRNQWTTARSETDSYEILSGIYQEKTTGTPLCVIFQNRDEKSSDYEQHKHIWRPGHADYTGYVKSHGANDPRGGGHFSARLTAPLVFAGAIAEFLLYKRNIHLVGHIKKVGDVHAPSLHHFALYDETLEVLNQMHIPMFDSVKEQMLQIVSEARDASDSVGAQIEMGVYNIPVGLGAPFFDTVESRLSYGLFAIPALKGVSFGDGFDFASKKGSEVVDAFILDHQGSVKTNANHNGGINGGITNGMPILFDCVFKPTASIGIEQETLDAETDEMTCLKITGRHDPCVALRAVPIVKAVTALVLLDLLIEEEGLKAYE